MTGQGETEHPRENPPPAASSVLSRVIAVCPVSRGFNVVAVGAPPLQKPRRLIKFKPKSTEWRHWPATCSPISASYHNRQLAAQPMGNLSQHAVANQTRNPVPRVSRSQPENGYVDAKSTATQFRLCVFVYFVTVRKLREIISRQGFRKCSVNPSRYYTEYTYSLKESCCKIGDNVGQPVGERLNDRPRLRGSRDGRTHVTRTAGLPLTKSSAGSTCAGRGRLVLAWPWQRPLLAREVARCQHRHVQRHHGFLPPFSPVPFARPVSLKPKLQSTQRTWERALRLFGYSVLLNVPYWLGLPTGRVSYKALTGERRSKMLLPSDAILLAQHVTTQKRNGRLRQQKKGLLAITITECRLPFSACYLTCELAAQPMGNRSQKAVANQTRGSSSETEREYRSGNIQIFKQGVTLSMRIHTEYEAISHESWHGCVFPNTVRCIIAGPSGCGKTRVLLRLLEEGNGLRFKNVYLYSKSLQQPKYQRLARVLQALDGVGYFPCSDNEAVVPPSEALQNSIFVFDDIVCEKLTCIQEYLAWVHSRTLTSVCAEGTLARCSCEDEKLQIKLSSALNTDEHTTPATQKSKLDIEDAAGSVAYHKYSIDDDYDNSNSVEDDDYSLDGPTHFSNEFPSTSDVKKADDIESKIKVKVTVNSSRSRPLGLESLIPVTRVADP
ncbi:hypothetical protein PR048_013913 [Dryococelus australis]|uniref:Uncharacterized protein n=1 Tax=Dryococelus australis TaxID=614101 RepID=A0ABQ9HUE9_9NEOP|nr:hypothetical protein PR048_013913 [Dryococelus australis]